MEDSAKIKIAHSVKITPIHLGKTTMRKIKQHLKINLHLAQINSQPLETSQ